MALVTLAWNLPQSGNMEAYNAQTRKWIGRVLDQPGVKEWRAYRHPLHGSPEVMTHIEFDSLDSALQYLNSEARDIGETEMREVGCTEFVWEVWDASPVAPEPLRPG